MNVLKKFARISVSVLVLLLASCANQRLETSNPAEELDKFIGSQSSEETEVPDAVTQSLLNPGFTSGAAKQQESQSRFDVSVSNVPAKVFFVSLVSDAGTNVVAHPEISGSISLELKDVTVDEVLEVVRDIYGYEHKKTGGIYTIFPRKLRTEIFNIDYLDVQRVGVTDTSVLVGEITSNSGGGNNNNNNSNNNSNNNGNGGNNSGGNSNLLSYLDDSSSESSSRSPRVSPGTRVQTLSKADFWSGLNQAILQIVGGDEGGRFVMTNPQSGVVVVKAMPNEIGAVREFLRLSELSVKRQVVLETKILEVSLNDEFEAGINWGAISGEIALQQVTSGPATLDQITISGNGTSDSLATSIINIDDITSLLQLIERQGNVQVLSSPRVSTVNNQKAVIRVGSDEFFVTGLSNNTTASASTVVTSPEVELDSFFSGISLDVTPQISEDGEVILHIHPLVSNVQDQIKEINISGDIFSLPLALRDVRESDSIVKARSGEVVVLGGLMQESSNQLKTKRPFVGDVPGLNALFKQKQRLTNKTELVILLRPIVIEDDGWQKVLDDDRSRLDAISELYRDR